MPRESSSTPTGGENEQSEDTNDRIPFTCIDCGKDIDREPNQRDLPGFLPKRCFQCMTVRMSK